MAMRRTRRAMRAPKRRSEWLAGANGDCLTRLNVTSCAVDADPDYFSLVNNPADAIAGDVSAVGEVTLVRLVGDLWAYSNGLAAAASTPQFWTVAFYVGVFIADLGTIQGSAMDPIASADASSKDWLWRGLLVHSYCTGGGEVEVCQCTPFSSGENHPHLDIRVKRKIRKEEGILLAISAKFDFPPPSGFPRIDIQTGVYANVRGLVLLP